MLDQTSLFLDSNPYHREISWSGIKKTSFIDKSYSEVHKNFLEKMHFFEKIPLSTPIIGDFLAFLAIFERLFIA
jgi:hypothetical protein